MKGGEDKWRIEGGEAEAAGGEASAGEGDEVVLCVAFGSGIGCNVLCKKPYQKGPMKYGCGTCMPCRINLRRLWVGRMLLESYEHPASTFLTLTYNDFWLPESQCLSKTELQRFMKRLRKAMQPIKLRYYGVGEYGEQNSRPHFHLIVFGLSPLEVAIVQKCWIYGFVQAGTVTPDSVSYTCGYVTKKLTNWDDRRFQEGALKGRSPEFSLMSKKPGLGFGVVEKFKKAYQSEAGSAALLESGWFAQAFQVGSFRYGLGQYLKAKTAEALSLGDKERTEHLWSRIREACEQRAGKTLAELNREYYAKVKQQSWKHFKRRTL